MVPPMMQRYFVELAYNGAGYNGWQIQPGETTVQQVLEDAFSTILGQEVELSGCGRTDTGVHASQYFAHFNSAKEFPEGFLRRVNKYLPRDISVARIFPVHWDAHARFDAYYRSYAYFLSFKKDPFHLDTCFYYPYLATPDPERMQAAAALIRNYQAFFPFCKSGHNAKTMLSTLYRSEWEFFPEEQTAVFHIAANRFLRGMVRLIVGMCLEVGAGRMTLEEVKTAMDRQERLPKSLSVPPQGLFLTEVRYPFLDETGNYHNPSRGFDFSEIKK